MSRSSITCFRTVALATTALLAAACDSGGSAAGLPSTVTPAASDSPITSGFLQGELYLDGTLNSARPIRVMLSDDFQFRAYFTGPDAPVLRGSFDLEGLLMEGEGIAIAGPGQSWSNGEPATTMSIWGSLVEPSITSNGKLLANVSMGSGDAGRIDAEYMTYVVLIDGSDLANLAGTWRAYLDGHSWWDVIEPPPSRFIEIDVGTDGAFSGTDDDGCSVAGRFTVIEGPQHFWGVEYAMADCARAGGYSGLAVVTVDQWFHDSYLTVTADDSTRSQVLEFTRSGP